MVHMYKFWMRNIRVLDVIATFLQCTNYFVPQLSLSRTAQFLEVFLQTAVSCHFLTFSI